MDLKIGVIGTGSIGRDHIRRIMAHPGGASVVAVSDINRAAAAETAGRYGAELFEAGADLIASPRVDAILVTSSDATHEQYVLGAVARQKPVFCEKPLAPKPEGARRVVDAEVRGGRHLVQVGYMRRYDPGYRQLKNAISSGRLGAPLMVHCAHRNLSSDEGYTTADGIENSAVHEFDVIRWLLDEDFASARVVLPRASRYSPAGQRDPQIILLQSRSGVAVDIEVFVNCRYGYDIKCEVCCEDGSITLPEPGNAELRTNGARSTGIFADWLLRFETAYDVEIQDWIDNARAGRVAGPSAWDGYLATYTAACCTKALQTGEAVPLSIEETPAFYR